MNILKFFFLAVSILLSSFSLQAQKLDVFLTVNRFYQPDTKEHYVEISYLVPAAAVKYAINKNNKHQAKLKVSFLLENKKDFKSSKSYMLQSPEYNSILDINANLTDLIRLNVPENDTTNLIVKLEDVNDSTRFSNELEIYIPKTKEAFLSDIMLINNVENKEKNNAFSRNGMLVVPKFLNYYPTEIEEIKFYNEFYQADKKEDYLLSYLLTNEAGLYVDGYAAHKKIVNKKYEVIIAGFNISKLPSGNYYLFIELKNSKNEIIERKRTFFQRNNQNKTVVENVNAKQNELRVITNNFARKYDLRNIKHHLAALEPIAGYFEAASIEGLKSSDDLEQLQNYFYSFWIQKDKENPEAAWNAYAEKLKYVEKTFTNLNFRGFETDRGRVYLRHGEPYRQNLKRQSSVGEFWLWNYENIDGQANVYFIFVNRSNLSDDFALVHTSLRGGVFNKDWAEYLKDEL